MVLRKARQGAFGAPFPHLAGPSFHPAMYSQSIVPPHPALAPWIYPLLLVGFPTGCLSRIPAAVSPALILFARGGGWRTDAAGKRLHRYPRAVLAGPCLTPRFTEIEADSVFVSMLFRPGLLAEALGPSVAEFRDHTFALDEVFPPLAVQRMLERVDEDANPLRWAGHVQQLVHTALRDGRDVQRAVAETGSMTRLFEPVEAQAAALSIGLRQFERRIGRAYGANLRDLRRLARFGFALPRLFAAGGQRGHVARVAQEFGYYDQAHMDRDFTALTGYSPRTLMQSSAGDDPGFWLYRIGQPDFRSLFLPEDVDSVQERVFVRA